MYRRNMQRVSSIVFPKYTPHLSGRRGAIRVPLIEPRKAIQSDRWGTYKVTAGRSKWPSCVGLREREGLSN